MEILSLSKTSFKIKGKKASIVIDPDDTFRAKVAADAALILYNKDSFSTAKVEEYRVVFNGLGEYEISGVKITGIKIGKHPAYKVSIDGMDIAIASVSSVESGRDILSDHHVLILYADQKIDPSVVATLEPRIAIFYGEQAKEFIGRDDIAATGKFLTTKEKLPEKMETVLLASSFN